MAKTQVTMKLEIFDVQLIADALTVYAAFMRTGGDYVGAGDNEQMVTVPLYNGSSAYCRSQAERLAAEIGLRAGTERPPQLRMWGDGRVDTNNVEPVEDVTGAEATGKDAEIDVEDVAGDAEDAVAAEDGHIVAEVILKTTDEVVLTNLQEELAG